MAQGTFSVFYEFLDNIGKNTGPNPGTDTFKIMLIDNTLNPGDANTSPDSSDYTEVTGNGYTAGGETANVTWSQTGNTVTFTLDDAVTWTSTGTGDPNDIYWAILYSTTHAGSEDAVGYIEMHNGGTPLDLNNGDITINAGTFFTMSTD